MENLKVLKKWFGKQIRLRREELGFKSQYDFAVALDTTQPRVSKWETGEYLPDPEILPKLMSVLKVDESYFDPEKQRPEINAKTIGEYIERLERTQAVPKMGIYEY